MNKFLPSLLLIFALSLCGLCTFQWLREGRLLKEAGGLNEDLYRKRESIQTLESTIRRHVADIKRLEEIRNDLNQTIVTNRQEIAELKKYAEKLEKETETQKQQIGSYRDAINTANDRLQQQNDAITKQNETIKALAQQRDEKVGELVKLAEEYNKVVKDFNTLQEQVNKLNEQQQQQQQKQPPPPKKN